MKSARSRSGIIFEFALVVFTSLVLLTLLYFLLTDPLAQRRTALGKVGLGLQAIELYQVYQDAENAAFYAEMAAQDAARRALFDLAAAGGASGEEAAPCGALRAGEATYAAWNTQPPLLDCTPPYREAFLARMSPLFDGTYAAYRARSVSLAGSKRLGSKRLKRLSVGLPSDNYHLLLHEQWLIGDAKKPLHVTRKNIDYILWPSFRILLPPSLDEYTHLTAGARKLLDACSGLAGDAQELCVTETVQALSTPGGEGRKWHFEECRARAAHPDAAPGDSPIRAPRAYCFSVESERELFSAASGAAGFARPVYRFALLFG